MKFGIGIPTGTEGLMYPIPFAHVRDNIKMAKAAEKLGFDSVWAMTMFPPSIMSARNSGCAPTTMLP